MNFNSKIIPAVMFTIFVVLVITAFLSIDKGLSLDVYEGPLNFWLRIPGIYVILGFASLAVFLAIPKLKNKSSLFSTILFIALGAYVVKLLIPYFILNGFVHYDIFRYLDVKILASEGLQFERYFYWPNTFVLTEMFEQVTGTTFPLNTSLIAISSKVILALLLFGFVKTLFGRREAVLSILLLTLVEPSSLHWCPFTITLTVIFVSFTSFFYAVFRNDMRFKIISVIAALSSILYHPFLPVILGIILIVGVCCLALLPCFPSVRVGKPSIHLASATLIGTIGWWLYVSFFVFKQFITTVEGVVIGEPISLVPIAVSPSLPEIANQLEFITMLGRFTLFIILLPVIPVLLWAFRLIVQKRLDVKYIKMLFLTSVTITMGFIWFLLGFVAPVGFGERFLFISEVLLASLSGVCMLEVARKKEFKKMIYLLFAVLFIGAVAISPITNRSDYAIMHLAGITGADTRAATFIATYSTDAQSLTGDARFVGIIELFRWPNSLPFSSEFEDKVKSESFDYSSEIIVSPTTPIYVTGAGVKDDEAAMHIAGLYSNFNPVYSNGYNIVFATR